METKKKRRPRYNAGIGASYVVSRPFDMKADTTAPGLSGRWVQFKVGDIFLVVDIKKDRQDMVLYTVLHPEFGLCMRYMLVSGFRSDSWARYVSPLSLLSSP